MERIFQLKKHGTGVRTELMAGLTTFMAMAYILIVNSNMFADGLEGQVTYGAIYIATAISAVIGSVLLGLLANLPLSQASAMGPNSFFVYTLCVGFGMTYANALVLVFIEGLLFIILTITGLRKMIFTSIPDAVRKAIPAGIGLFIALIGFQNAGLVRADPDSGVALGSFNLLSNPDNSWSLVFPMIITFVVLCATAVLSVKKVKGALLWSIIGGSVLYYAIGLLTVPSFYEQNLAGSFSGGFFSAFRDFGTMSIGKVFTEGFDFSHYIEAHGVMNFVLILATSALALCLVDMFDTLGTLYGACAKGGLLKENGDVPNMEKAMLADAIATTTGAICGTSTVSVFVESATGIEAGGRTGLSSVFTALFFLLAMFLSPIAKLIPACATAAVLIYVGVMMMSCISELNWHDPTYAVPSFLTMVMMPFSYNISIGIAFGLISYIIVKLCLGKIREIKAGTWVIAVLFLAMLFLSH